jgi:hypothetical protein
LISDPGSPASLILNFDHLSLYGDAEKEVIVRQIAQKLPEVVPNFESKLTDREFYDTHEPLLFFCDSDIPKTHEFGCLTLKSKNIELAKRLLYYEELSINNSYRDWSVLKHFKLPINSLVITDNYFLQNDKSLENLKMILLSLMPSSLKIVFDLTIIGYSAKDFVNLATQFENISQFLKANYSYSVNLSIVREDFHARNIFTNYTRFDTDKGFGLFENGRIKPRNYTTLKHVSYTDFGIRSKVYDLVKSDLEKGRKIAGVNRLKEREIGSKTNRLFPQKPQTFPPVNT